MLRLVKAGAAVLLIAALASPAYAGGRRHGHHYHHHGHSSAEVVLGLAAVAVLAPLLYHGAVYERRIVYAPAVVYEPPRPHVVYYPNGRYEFYGQRWVWIPYAPLPPAVEPCWHTGRYVMTPHGVLPECR